MTNEEANYKYDRAIDLIKRIKTEETHEREIDRHKAFDLAISALEKQIPKKPIYEDIGNIYGALKRTCVNCGDVCMVSKCGIPFEHYCRYCGQKLNWSEEE